MPELLATFNPAAAHGCHEILWFSECDDQMTSATFAWTLSGVDLVRRRDQSDPSRLLSVGRWRTGPRVWTRPIPLQHRWPHGGASLCRGQQGKHHHVQAFPLWTQILGQLFLSFYTFIAVLLQKTLMHLWTQFVLGWSPLKISHSRFWIIINSTKFRSTISPTVLFAPWWNS